MTADNLEAALRSIPLPPDRSANRRSPCFSTDWITNSQNRDRGEPVWCDGARDFAHAAELAALHVKDQRGFICGFGDVITVQCVKSSVDPQMPEQQFQAIPQISFEVERIDGN